MQSTTQNGLHNNEVTLLYTIHVLEARRKVSNSIQNFAHCGPVNLFTANMLLLLMWSVKGRRHDNKFQHRLDSLVTLIGMSGLYHYSLWNIIFPYHNGTKSQNQGKRQIMNGSTLWAVTMIKLSHLTLKIG
jgi:hypothetical protein